MTSGNDRGCCSLLVEATWSKLLDLLESFEIVTFTEERFEASGLECPVEIEGESMGSDGESCCSLLVEITFRKSLDLGDESTSVIFKENILDGGGLER